MYETQWVHLSPVKTEKNQDGAARPLTPYLASMVISLLILKDETFNLVCVVKIYYLIRVLVHSTRNIVAHLYYCVVLRWGARETTPLPGHLKLGIVSVKHTFIQ